MERARLDRFPPDCVRGSGKMTKENLFLEKKDQSESSKNYVYRMLFKNIVFLRLIPGEIISENMISDVFSVSRTPVRDAILRLAADELLAVYPQKGTYVSYINMDRVRESIFMRIVLESEAIRLACRTFDENAVFLMKSNLERQVFCYEKGHLEEVLELDNDFHKILFETNRLPRVWKAMQSINTEQYRIRYLKLLDQWRWEETIEEHRTQIRDIEDGDEEKAAADIRKHVASLYDDAKIVAQHHKSFFERD